jgi:hypothetical protein
MAGQQHVYWAGAPLFGRSTLIWQEHPYLAGAPLFGRIILIRRVGEPQIRHAHFYMASHPFLIWHPGQPLYGTPVNPYMAGEWHLAWARVWAGGYEGGGWAALAANPQSVGTRRVEILGLGRVRNSWG